MRLWHKQDITVEFRYGHDKQQVKALVCPLCPGLAIHRAIEPPDKAWQVTHIQSGLSAGQPRTKVEAMRTLLALPRAGVDWTMTPNELISTHGRTFLRAVVDTAMRSGKQPPMRQQLLFAA